MKSQMARVVRSLALLVLVLAVSAPIARAAPENPALSFSMSSSASLGDVLDLKAQLTTAAGAPIAGVPIFFTLPATFFLGSTSDVVIARVVTSKEGIAEAQYQARDAGQLTIRAEFRGNEKYAPAKTSAQMTVADGHGQLYVQEAGVHIPGLTGAPSLGTQAGAVEGGKSGLAALWPTMSFWPIGLVLAIVWSLYVYVVVQIFRIVNAAGRPEGSPLAGKVLVPSRDRGRGPFGGGA